MTDIYDKKERNLRLIVIDDEPSWSTMLGHMARSLGHALDAAHSPEEGQVMLQQAESAGRPYSIAIIDLNFKIGKIALNRGQELIQYIKAHHPAMACIVASGEKVLPDNVLDLRDEYDLDYYVQKDRISLDIFRKALRKALARVTPSLQNEDRRKLLQKTLEKWQHVRMMASHNLANVKEREALKGIDVDVTTLNEIAQYETRVAEANEQIRALRNEIEALTEHALK